MKQEFQINDLVHIKKELPGYMSHFPKDKDAIVVEYSHNKYQAGSDFEHEYGLHIKDHGYSAWYQNSNLELVERNKYGLRKQWAAERYKIHPRFKKYHKHATCPKECSLIAEPCGNWVACGYMGSCLFSRNGYIPSVPTIPCRWCGMWSGWNLKNWEIENLAVMMEIIVNR